MPETLRSWANGLAGGSWCGWWRMCASTRCNCRSEEHTSELQSRLHLVCRLLLEKIKRTRTRKFPTIVLKRHYPDCANMLASHLVKDDDDRTGCHHKSYVLELHAALVAVELLRRC